LCRIRSDFGIQYGPEGAGEIILNVSAATRGCIMSELACVTIYTDGACFGNPGPGGYAAVLLCGFTRMELSGGRRLTTSNRMELLAAITALEALKRPCRVTLYSDSQYLVDAVMKGWASRWRANGWKRNRKEFAVNTDLWGSLLDLCAQHEVEFVWVQGHAGNPENERCDALSIAASRSEELPVDTGYEEQPERAASSGVAIRVRVRPSPVTPAFARSL
jgi:ribonuclease HI